MLASGICRSRRVRSRTRRHPGRSQQSDPVRKPLGNVARKGISSPAEPPTVLVLASNHGPQRAQTKQLDRRPPFRCSRRVIPIPCHEPSKTTRTIASSQHLSFPIPTSSQCVSGPRAAPPIDQAGRGREALGEFLVALELPLAFRIDARLLSNSLAGSPISSFSLRPFCPQLHDAFLGLFPGALPRSLALASSASTYSRRTSSVAFCRSRASASPTCDRMEGMIPVETELGPYRL